MDRREAYLSIVDSFEKKYSFLGRQWAEEFLLSVASWNLQQYSSPQFRVRRHPLLFWGPGWIKSTLLTKAYDVLGPDLCTYMSDISRAAMRGSVMGNSFVTPATLLRPFAISTEFGQVIGGDTEIVQHLLNALEEGVVSVNLVKVSLLSAEEIARAQRDYNIVFTDKNTFTYRTNWVLMAGTYNRKFLVDNAFESRFIIMTPEKKLDTDLVKHVNRSGPFILDGEAVNTVRREVMLNKSMDARINLPEEIYDYKITMRDSGSIASHLLCKKWWGLKTTNDDAVALAKKLIKTREEVWKGAEDKVWESLEEGSKTIDELATDTGVSKRSVYYAIGKLGLRNSKELCPGGIIKYKI